MERVKRLLPRLGRGGGEEMYRRRSLRSVKSHMYRMDRSEGLTINCIRTEGFLLNELVVSPVTYYMTIMILAFIENMIS